MVIDENEYKKVISNNLRDLAIKRDVTQREIVDAVGVSYATVSEWMNGKKIPRMGKIDLLCDFFKCTRSDIMEPRDAKKHREITAEQAELISTTMTARPENVALVLEMLKRLEGIK